MTPLATAGIARADAIYQDRAAAAKELKKQGKRVMGYFCLFPPVEIMTALDIVPYRMLGNMKEQITEGDRVLPQMVCPFLRSCLDLGIKGKFDFLDGIVFSHGCDVSQRMVSVWRTYVPMSFSFLVDTPHSTHAAAVTQERALLGDFIKSLENLTGQKLTNTKLAEAVKLHNRQRALVREMYELRKQNPPLITGAETLKVIVAIMTQPVREGNDLLTEVIAEAKRRKNPIPANQPRLMIWGSIIDDSSIIEMIEELGASVVIDDTCVGSRAYFADVPVTGDPLDGISEHYLTGIKCPRTCFEKNIGATSKKDYGADLEFRFSYLKDYAEKWKVKGVILEAMRYCDTHGFEAPEIKSYMESLGYPTIFIEPVYSETALAQLKTRLQGFLEIME